MSTAQTHGNAVTLNGPRLHIRLNGLAILGMAVVAYALAGGSWWLFLGLLLVPDVFMLGYIAGPRVGAHVYNVGHSLLWPVALVSIGLVTSLGPEAVAGFAGAGAGRSSGLLRVGVIWAAHIGLDRAFGFGYKYTSAFSDTDIGSV